MAVKKIAEETKKKIEPFKTRRTKTLTTTVSDTVTPKEEIAQAIDMFREAQEQARHFEGEATVYKDTILDFAEGEYVRRLSDGYDGSFKIMGEQSQVTYVVTDTSSGLSDEDVAAIAERWNKKAAEDMITRDFRSIRFDEKVLEAHYDEVVEALQVLPDNVLENLFKPMLMKIKPGAADIAKKIAKNTEDLRELLRALKIKSYIK